MSELVIEPAQPPLIDAVIPDDPSPSPEETAATPEPNKPKGVQVRLNELTAARREAERDRDHWRELALRQAPTPTPEPVVAETGEPKPEDFTDYAAYTKAVAKHEIRQELAAAETKAKEAQAQQYERTQMQSFQAKAQALVAQVPDYHEVADYVPINDATKAALLSSDMGPALLYHLGKNPQLAEQIHAMTPYQAAMQLGRLEAQLSVQKPKQLSSAPEPLTNALAGDGSVEVDDLSISADEYRKRWNRRMLDKSRRQ